VATRNFQLFSGRASKHLAEQIAAIYPGQLGNVDVQQFRDGEMQPIYGESIRGNEVFIVQSTGAPADNLMELLLMIDAAKRASANSITAVIPYFGYARQDRKDRPRVSLGAKLVADLLQAAGINRVVTMDLHAGQIQGFFDIPVDNLEASSVFVPYLEALGLPNLTVASPDMGGVTRARAYAEALKGSLILVDKHRERANAVKAMQIIGDVRDKHVVIVDDIVDTGNTLCLAAQHIMDSGAASVRAAITHPILSGSAVELIENSVLTELLVTDTIPLKITSDKIKVLSIASVFAAALRNIFEYESVSTLFLKAR